MYQNSISLCVKNHLLPLTRPLVMGILNVTPDSFYSKSRTQSDDELMRRVEQIVSEGADIIDIGGCSTRPFAGEVDEQEELKRLFAALHIVRRSVPDAIVSVDTFRASVAETVIKAFDIDIVNDVSGESDDTMVDVVARYRRPYVLMHTRGTPQTMQQLTHYDSFEEELMRFFALKINRLCARGVNDIIIDPGFGFAKTGEQNYELLRLLPHFKVFERPVLAGISRKRMLYEAIGTNAENSLAATVAANTLALAGGASILRVHDVKEAVDAVAIYQRTYNQHI